MSNIDKLSHKEWRKIAKKRRRKNLRQKIAKERDALHKEQLKNPSHLTWLAEQNALDLAKKESAEHLRNQTQKQWQEYDCLVQERWKIKQEKLAKIKEAQQQEKSRIREEFEEKKKQTNKLKEEKIRLAEEKLKKHEKLVESINEYMNGTGDLPDELKVNAESNPGKATCPFFEKTSTCRYGIKCSRNHCRPGISRLLLIPNFFSHIRLEQSQHTEYGNDFSLEIDDAELNRDFNEFFSDVEPELSRFGRIINFCVCSNHEPHLRGHTYVEYEDQRHALKACRHLHGRYYGGRMLNVEFSQLISWRSAVCGLSFANKCPKGRNCNFLHIFKNPRNLYPLFSQHRSNVSQQWLSTTRRKAVECRRNEGRNYLNWDECDDDSSQKRYWRWSVSPENPSTTSRIRQNPNESSRQLTKSLSMSKSHSERQRHIRSCENRRTRKKSKSCRRKDDEKSKLYEANRDKHRKRKRTHRES